MKNIDVEEARVDGGPAGEEARTEGMRAGTAYAVVTRATRGGPGGDCASADAIIPRHGTRSHGCGDTSAQSGRAAGRVRTGEK